MADFWFKFEWDDWLGDENLLRCSLETQGLWIRCIAMMHKMGVCEITGTVDEVRRLLGILPEELMRCAEELARTGTADVTIGHNNVTLVSRRLERLANKRVSATERKQKSRGHNDVTTQSLEYRVKSKEESTNVDSKNTQEPQAAVCASDDPNSEPPLEEIFLGTVTAGITKRLDLTAMSLSAKLDWQKAGRWAITNGFTADHFLECFELLQKQHWRHGPVKPSHVTENLPNLKKLRDEIAKNGKRNPDNKNSDELDAATAARLGIT